MTTLTVLSSMGLSFGGLPLVGSSFFGLAFMSAESAEAVGPPWGGLLLAAVLIFLNGFFVAAEFALIKVRETQLGQDETRLGRLASKMKTATDKYVAACQLGITLASLGLGWVGEPAFAWFVERLFAGFELSEALSHTISAIFAFTIITILHIVIGEQVPKVFAYRNSLKTTMWLAYPMRAFYLATLPLNWVLERMTAGVLRLLGVKSSSHADEAVDEMELRTIMASERKSELTQEKRDLLDNVFELSDRIARHVMVPRSEVVYLDLMKPVEENLTVARQSGHTRFPLCEEDLDHVLGIVHIKDLFRATKPPKSLEDVRRDTFFVPETISLDEVLRRMRTERVHMAAVLDEYGGISGLITLENIIEEIVGEIQDEFDYERPEVMKDSEGVYTVLGSVLIRDLEDVLGIDIASGDREEDTIAGCVLSELGRRGKVGDRVEVGPLEIEVREIDNNRIEALRVHLNREETEPEVVDS